jgi:sigma-B regulation protein RsbU (phosphoserine phosphatase)
VAGWGVDVSDFAPVPIDDEVSVAARVFRECDSVLRNASDDETGKDPDAMTRPYRGKAFLSVPIVYPDPEGVARPVGVINLTDRLSEDVFSHGHAKLVTAIAHQIGAAIENARLVELDRERQRVRQELQLAHDLQLRLLPSPTLLGSQYDVAAICRSAESVGGDFYNFVPLPGSQVGVMLGDVSSHGFPAALIMALVLSAAGIHAVAAESPEVALDRLLASVNSELAKTEMYLSLFYGVIDAEHGILRFANAGHPHAFCIPREGRPVPLKATAPPLGLGEPGPIKGDSVKWDPDSDLLVLFSDGITEARNSAKEFFGVHRVLDIVCQTRNNPAAEIVEAVFQAVSSFADGVDDDRDDRTVVVLKA